jgi:hypothetical protein
MKTMCRWVLLGSLAAAAAHAQASLSAYNGVYLYVESTDERERIQRSIEKATEDMGLLRRGIARNRLEEATRPFPRLEMFFDDENVLLRYSQREFELPLDGTSVEATGLMGDPVEASAYLRAHDLHQTLEGDRGTRYIEFRFNDDDTVSMVNRIESEHLPSQVKYTLTYRPAR